MCKIKCTKRIFANRQDALNAITRIANSGIDGRVPRNAYHCADCKGWHITAISKKRRRSDVQETKESIIDYWMNRKGYNKQ